VNVNATTELDSILTITNNGQQEIEVYFEVEPAGSLPAGVTTFEIYKGSASGTPVDSGNKHTISTANSEGFGLKIVTDDTVSTGSYNIDITVHADVTTTASP
jgi:hypothetical protein